MKDLFDTALYNRYLAGPSPKVRDNAAQGCHLKWMKRFRLRACPSVYDSSNWFHDPATTPSVESTHVHQGIHVWNGSFGGTAISMTEPVKDNAFPVPHIKDADIGLDYVSQHKAFTFGGAGLKVQYEDAGLIGTVDENHLFLLFASSNAGTEATSAPTKCPRLAFSYRLWYTDD